MQQSIEEQAEEALRFFAFMHGSPGLSPEAQLIYTDGIHRLANLLSQKSLTAVEFLKIIEHFRQELDATPPILQQELESFRQVLLRFMDLATRALDEKRF